MIVLRVAMVCNIDTLKIICCHLYCLCVVFGDFVIFIMSTCLEDWMRDIIIFLTMTFPLKVQKKRLI